MTNNPVLSLPAMAPDSGRLVMIDAVDGTGKSTAQAALINVLRKTGRLVHDYDRYGPEDISDEADTLSLSEPTVWGVGQLIRRYFLPKDSPYNAVSTAQAFALDREMLYRRTVIPFLKKGGLVIQVRGILSSLVYQTLQAEDEGIELSPKTILELPGNHLALSRRPDLILILTVSAEEVKRRLASRPPALNEDRFTNPHFQARAALAYKRPEFLEPLRRLGTRIEFVEADGPPQEVADACVRHLESVLARPA
jgi:thymidylate kinase